MLGLFLSLKSPFFKVYYIIVKVRRWRFDKVENINKSFPINGNETHVLTNINFKISKGDIFGIVGKTGAGKSTLLRLINGFIAPDSGEIIFKGKNLNKASRKSLIKYTSMIFQNYNLLNNLNVIENVLLPVKLHKLNDVDYKRSNWFLTL